MTDIEKQALALVNEVRAERRDPPMVGLSRDCFASQEALCRLIEQHEAFRQEVSDAVAPLLRYWPEIRSHIVERLSAFIIAKRDLVQEAIRELGNKPTSPSSDDLRAALAARGLKIVEVGHD